MSRRPGPTTRTRVIELRGDERLEHEDRLATEEPLEIRVGAPGVPPHRVAITMRTPGHDFELAVGWLVHQGVCTPDQVTRVAYCTDADLTEEQEFNVVTVGLDSAPLTSPTARLIDSACGVCGTDALAESSRASLPQAQVPLAVARSLPERLREAQPTFARTGGLHAAALADADGSLVVVREDVGRHNAVDKVVGARVLVNAPLPPVLVLSGRIGFELVQKASASGLPVVVAVGAPTSLAVRLAQDAGITLIGFTRAERCVVYSASERLG